MEPTTSTVAAMMGTIFVNSIGGGMKRERLPTHVLIYQRNPAGRLAHG